MTGKQLLDIFQQPSPRIQSVVHVGLILLLAASLAQLSWRILPASELPPLLPQPTRSETVTANVNSSLTQQIPAWHLFGELSKVVEVAPVDLPETNLKLTLRGLIASSNQDEARAIVADARNQENFYKVGDKLPGNAELKEIHADRIVIQRSGRFETLKLPKDELNLGNTAPQVSSRSPRSRRAVGPRETYSLGEYRDTLLRDPQRVADLIQIQPANRNGRFIGYSVQPGRDATFLTRYGLMPGDVVTSVNGVKLDSPAKGFGLVKDLTSAEVLDLVIDRNGVEQRFSLPVN